MDIDAIITACEIHSVPIHLELLHIAPITIKAIPKATLMSLMEWSAFQLCSLLPVGSATERYRRMLISPSQTSQTPISPVRYPNRVI